MTANHNAFNAQTAAYPWTIDDRTKLAQWSKDARRRSHTRMLDAVRKHRDMKQRLFDTEVQMEHAAADYQRTVLAGAHLPPVLSTIRFTAHTIHSEREA